jgi:hypothetical protein
MSSGYTDDGFNVILKTSYVRIEDHSFRETK